MKIKQVVLLLFSCLTLALDAQETKIQNLKSSFLQNDWDTFFEAFPETFEEFLNIYGYDENGPRPLYSGYEHINFLFSSSRIYESYYFNKLLSLTQGYKWDADAPNYLSDNIFRMLMENPARIIDLLHNKKQTEIINFLRCAIYTPYPKHEHYLNELNELIEKYRLTSPRIACCLMKAYREILYLEVDQYHCQCDLQYKREDNLYNHQPLEVQQQGGEPLAI